MRGRGIAFAGAPNRGGWSAKDPGGNGRIQRQGKIGVRQARRKQSIRRRKYYYKLLKKKA
jgi:hypothetical protein